MSIAFSLSGSRGYLSPCYFLRACQSVRRPQTWRSFPWRGLATTASPEVVPYRKQLKDEAKQRRIAGNAKQVRERQSKDAKAQRWELTVGIEVHAQLNTERKLFSRARTSIDAEPNTRVALFDLAYPGTQPEFQKATLIPALRAAIALKCNIQKRSRFDRKHYFYPDQPAGYQITQYYEPFARDGSITLYKHDGIAAEDGESITVGIKQIQMEQDTAKTIQQPPDTTLLDFNRVSHPLVEIITLPHIHHPETAAACVKKIQAVLEAVNAVFTGMEMGGLRADINVSVRLKEEADSPSNVHSYHGVSGLGQRTEIKNLSSFKAIEDAIIAERDRQIEVLESGGAIDGETRGWALGSTETTRLRGKEGEVDYRYMPDPDLAPVIIGQDLIDHISHTLPELPDETLQSLVHDLGVTQKDAKTLVASEDHGQLLYFDRTLFALVRLLQPEHSEGSELYKAVESTHAKLVANWVIHELTGLFTSNIGPCDWVQAEKVIPTLELAHILENLIDKRITGQTAKKLLVAKVDGDQRDVEAMIKEDDLTLRKIPREEYVAMAQALIDTNRGMALQVRKGQRGKLMWFVGQMTKQGKGSIEAEKAKFVLEDLLSGDAED